MELTEDEFKNILYGFHPEWVKSQSELVHFGPRSTTYTGVFYHLPTGKYYRFVWHGLHDSLDPFTPDTRVMEVEPKQVAVTQYVPVGQ